jgi:signal transduction histidine kinase
MPLRTVLLVLLLVPSVALVSLWGLATYQMGGQYREQAAQHELTTTVALPTAAVFNALEEERQLTQEALASPKASRSALTEQRAVTDEAVRSFRPLVTSLDTGNSQEGLATSLARTVRLTDRLAEERRAVDAGTSDGNQAFTYYSDAVQASIDIFASLARVSDGRVAGLSQVLFDMNGVVDMVNREDALLARGWASGRLSAEDHYAVSDAISTQRYLLEARVAPNLTPSETRAYEKLVKSDVWQQRVKLEDQLRSASAAETGDGDGVALPDVRAKWRAAVDGSVAELEKIVLAHSSVANSAGADDVQQLRLFLFAAGALGLVAVLLVVLVTWRLTRALRLRVLAVRDQAQDLGQRLPQVVSRLENGADVDVDAEVPVVEPAADELGELSRVLNAAGRTAVGTAVRQAEQHRGFERLLQRIARRTQLLIGLQLKKLDELERRHEDPEVLEGLFDLDHLTARLRRYEENLVILGGGQPRRRWRRPVPMLDVLRAAQGEVQDYRRIRMDVEGRPWISERAVGPLIHILAELMENATAFSKPPAPVEVKAAPVSRGIAVEIEDRGLGMEDKQYEAANALMQDPPQLDVMTRADDVRLGLYVVARLASSLGLQVELRPSAFGGTRVIVLVPQDLVVERPQSVPTRADRPSPDEEVPVPAQGPDAEFSALTRFRRATVPYLVDGPAEDGAGDLPVRSRGRAMADVTAPPSALPDEPAAPRSEPEPLPRRTRQASLAPELRRPSEAAEAPAVREPSVTPARSGATIGAFQRQSRKNRTAGTQSFASGTDQSEPPTREDRE